MFDLKIVAAAIAIGISFVSYIPYVLAMLRGKNQPHIYSWISIFIITCVVGLLQLVGGAGAGAWPTLIGASTYLLIILLCLRYGTNDIVRLDAICLGISLLGAGTFFLLRDSPAVSLLLVTAAEVVGFVPTWRKTLKAPFSESLSIYYFLLAKLVLILVATEVYNFLTLTNTLIWLVVMTGFVVSILIARKRAGLQVG